MAAVVGLGGDGGLFLRGGREGFWGGGEGEILSVGIGGVQGKGGDVSAGGVGAGAGEVGESVGEAVGVPVGGGAD